MNYKAFTFKYYYTLYHCLVNREITIKLINYKFVISNYI